MAPVGGSNGEIIAAENTVDINTRSDAEAMRNQLTSRRKSSIHSIVQVRPTNERLRSNMLLDSAEMHQVTVADKTYGSTVDTPKDGAPLDEVQENERSIRGDFLTEKKRMPWFQRAASQIPAVALLALFHLMVGIPFGVSYFPIEWKSTGHDVGDTGDVEGGDFPLPGKEALGIRMFLFSTVVAQIVFTFSSKFNDAIGLQMVENVPFCHSLAYIVIKQQGYGIEALSTLFFLFGLASVIVGAVFYVLGKFKLGRVVYFFPSHVLVGCIGGIGIFIAKTGVEVTTNSTCSLSLEGVKSFIGNLPLLLLVFLFEVILRLLTYFTRDKEGKPRYPVLPPIYFCMITPIFYLGLAIFGVDKKVAENAGYFFPSLDAGGDDVGAFALESIFNDELWNMWRIVDFSTISWVAVFNSIPTMVALVLFSLIHVPINIPAFAISKNAEADMNAELVAHGYSNALVGVFGGLQNYMAYTQSVIYFKSGGFGKASSLAVAFITSILFFVGPKIASYMPRCMAGTLLFHFGIDLFLEGVYDSFGSYDYLEYAGIWLITIVMTVYGMEAALIAGVIAALSTYAFQSITYLNPIRGIMSAATLRSSAWSRSPEINNILDDDSIGRKRILVIQLQGHLFFGNIAQLTDSVKDVLIEKHGTAEEPFIVIIDFSLILGIDSSAAQTITKLKSTLHKSFNINLCVFVTGSTNGFPCEYALSQELSTLPETSLGVGKAMIQRLSSSNFYEFDEEVSEEASLLSSNRNTTDMSKCGYSELFCASGPKSHVCNSLDSALIFAEDALVARQDPQLLNDELGPILLDRFSSGNERYLLSEENEIALQLFARLCPGENKDEISELFCLFKREVYCKNDILWLQGSSSDSMKLIVRGRLISVLENEAGTREEIKSGNTIGEYGLLLQHNRMSTVQCLSEDAVAYSLSRTSWEEIVRDKPNLARFVYLIVVNYLSSRVQHVSNRIFETRCLPI